MRLQCLSLVNRAQQRLSGSRLQQMSHHLWHDCDKPVGRLAAWLLKRLLVDHIFAVHRAADCIRNGDHALIVIQNPTDLCPF